MNHAETKLQIAIMRWWAAEWRGLGAPAEEFLFHVPNGGRRDARGAAVLKSMGVRPGIPDLFLPLARGGFHGLAVEIKDRVGSLSRDQARICLALLDCGYLAVIIRDFESAVKVIRDYLGPCALFSRHAQNGQFCVIRQ